MIKKTIIVAVCVSLLGSCEQTQNNPNTAGGAAIGGLLGAATGALVAKNNRRGALIGAGIGLLAGAAVGQYLDRQQRELEANLAGTGAQVTREGDALLVNFPSQITFATNSASIKPEFFSTLNAVVETLNRYPQSYLDVIGHTDSTGSEAHNQALSERRANSVADYMRTRGVAPQRIAAYGMGMSQPIASNATPEGRQQNRRVELRITPAT